MFMLYRVCVFVSLLFISLSLIFVFMSIHIGSAHNVLGIPSTQVRASYFARYTNIALFLNDQRASTELKSIMIAHVRFCLGKAQSRN